MRSERGGAGRQPPPVHPRAPFAVRARARGHGCTGPDCKLPRASRARRAGHGRARPGAAGARGRAWRRGVPSHRSRRRPPRAMPPRLPALTARVRGFETQVPARLSELMRCLGAHHPLERRRANASGRWTRKLPPPFGAWASPLFSGFSAKGRLTALVGQRGSGAPSSGDTLGTPQVGLHPCLPCSLPEPEPPATTCRRAAPRRTAHGHRHRPAAPRRASPLTPPSPPCAATARRACFQDPPEETPHFFFDLSKWHRNASTRSCR
jgi:hypothetical protein